MGMDWKDRKRQGVESYVPTFARTFRRALEAVRKMGPDALEARPREPMKERRRESQEPGKCGGGAQRGSRMPQVIEDALKDPASPEAFCSLDALIRIVEEGGSGHKHLAAQAIKAVIDAHKGKEEVRSSVRALVRASMRVAAQVPEGEAPSLEELGAALARNQIIEAIDLAVKADPALEGMAQIYERRKTIRPPPKG